LGGRGARAGSQHPDLIPHLSDAAETANHLAEHAPDARAVILSDVAHLPSSMVSKNEDECWLCHKPTASPPPQKPHPDTERLTCRSCHSSPEVGRLPFDHALRDDTTCVLCHDIAKSDPRLQSPRPAASIAPLPTATPAP